jgi:hypothetical protein
VEVPKARETTKGRDRLASNQLLAPAEPKPMAGADVDVGSERRLRQPGGGGFEDTIDLKLKLPTAGMEEAAAAKPEPAAEKAKRPAEAPAADAEKPPAPKYVYICKHVDLSAWVNRLKLIARSISYRLTVAI